MAGPFQSPAWKHLPEIRRLREDRTSWQKIAETLEKTHGVKLDPTGIGRVFSRATKGKLPAGFPDPFLEPKDETADLESLAEPANSSDDDGLEDEGYQKKPKIIVS